MGEPLPLAGIKVVEMTVAVAGPAAGMILGDWGADVVLVEAPGGSRGGLSALAGVPVESQYQDSPQGYMDNRGKRSVVLDMKTDEGKAAMEQLLSGADVFLSNFRAQALEVSSHAIYVHRTACDVGVISERLLVVASWFFVDF